MKEKICNIHIFIEDGIVSASIAYADEMVDFDISTILGDLLNHFVYLNKTDSVFDNYFFKEDYKSHPFFRLEKYHDEIEHYHSGNNGRISDGDVVYEINKLLLALVQVQDVFDRRNRYSLGEFDLLKLFSELTFNFKLQEREESQIGEEHYTTYAPPKMYKNLVEGGHIWEKKDEEGKVVSKYAYLDIYFDTTFGIMSEIKKYKTDNIPHRYSYECYSLEDMVYSVLHFLIFNEYKFKQCNHCGRYFVSPDYRPKYCNRNSNYENYTDRSCGHAVKNIMSMLKKREKDYGEELEKEGSYLSEVVEDFKKKCKRLRGMIQFEASEDNLQAYEEFLDPIHIYGNYINKKNYAL